MILAFTLSMPGSPCGAARDESMLSLALLDLLGRYR